MKQKKKRKIDTIDVMAGIGAVIIMVAICYGLYYCGDQIVKEGKQMFIGSYTKKEESLVSLDFIKDNRSKKVIIETKDRAAAISAYSVEFKMSNDDRNYVRYKQNDKEKAKRKEYIIYLTKDSAIKYSKECAKKINETMIIKEK